MPAKKDGLKRKKAASDSTDAQGAAKKVKSDDSSASETKKDTDDNG